MGNNIYQHYSFIKNTLKYLKIHLDVDNLRLDINYDNDKFNNLMNKIKCIIFDEINKECYNQCFDLINERKLSKMINYFYS